MGIFKNKKKIVAMILGAMMMASLAVPASAAATNETLVEFNYHTDQTIDENNGNYKITIPAKIELTDAGKIDNGAKGTAFTGEVGVSISGEIGQNDTVSVYVESENEYQLADSNGIMVADYVVGYPITKTFTGSCVTTMSDTTNNPTGWIVTWDARSVYNNASVSWGIKNSDSNKIYGKGTYTDTLTFTYTYNNSDRVSTMIDNGTPIPNGE